jgi:hypothetical protein
MAMLSLSDIKTHVGVDTIDTSYDAVLTLIGGAVEEFAEKCLDRYLAKADYEELHMTSIGSIWLHNTPIVSIASVRIGTTAKEDEMKTLDSGDYMVNEKTGHLTIFDYVQGVPSFVLVSYNGGYTILPDDLKFALLEQIKYWFGLYKSGSEAVTQVNVLGTSIQIAKPDDWLPFVKSILQRYRRISHG